MEKILRINASRIKKKNIPFRLEFFAFSDLTFFQRIKNIVLGIATSNTFEIISFTQLFPEFGILFWKGKKKKKNNREAAKLSIMFDFK